LKQEKYLPMFIFSDQYEPIFIAVWVFFCFFFYLAKLWFLRGWHMSTLTIL